MSTAQIILAATFAFGWLVAVVVLWRKDSDSVAFPDRNAFALLTVLMGLGWPLWAVTWLLMRVKIPGLARCFDFLADTSRRVWP